MDSKLISSPLLKDLTYNVYSQGHHTDQHARSEWRKLTQALVAGGNVRLLKIGSWLHSAYHGVILDDTEPETLMRLDLKPGMRLPHLEELTIRVGGYWGASPYLWDLDHCHLLRQAIDTSHFRKLDFGSDKPDTFFSTFTRLLPNLKALRFGIQQDGIAGSARRFIKSLKALEALDIDSASPAIDRLWPAIMKHKNTLKELVLRPTTDGYCKPRTIAIERLQTISIQFPKLERLGWDAPCGYNVSRLKLEGSRIR